MTYTTSGYLGLQLAVVGTKQAFDTGVFNNNLSKIESKLQNVEQQAQTAQGTANNANGAASNAYNHGTDAYNQANYATQLANNAQGTGNDATNRANNAQNTANDAYNRTSDLYNRTGGIVRAWAGSDHFAPSAVKTRTTKRTYFASGRFSSPPYVTVGLFSGVPDVCFIGVSNIGTDGVDVTLYRTNDTSDTYYNIIAIQT